MKPRENGPQYSSDISSGSPATATAETPNPPQKPETTDTEPFLTSHTAQIVYAVTSISLLIKTALDFLSAKLVAYHLGRVHAAGSTHQPLLSPDTVVKLAAWYTTSLEIPARILATVTGITTVEATLYIHMGELLVALGLLALALEILPLSFIKPKENS